MKHLILSIAIFIITVTGSPTMTDAVEPVNIPPADQLLKLIKPTHPRLLLDTARITELKSLIESDPVAKRYYHQLRESGKQILTQPPSKYEIPDGLRLLSTSRRVLKRTYTLALLYHLEQDQKYVDRVYEELLAAANFPDWNPRHFLDTGEMTHAFAIGYDWLYHQWTDEQRELIRNAIIKHGLTPGLKSYRGEEKYGWFVSRTNNWNQVCNAGLAVGAIAIAETHPEISGEILHSGLKSIQVSMPQLAPDGACPEGPAYWGYATQYICLYLASLQSALGSDFGLSNLPGINTTGHFPIYMTSPIGKSFNFADANAHAVDAPQLYFLATLFNQPAYRNYQERFGNGHTLDLLWYKPDASDPSKSNWPLDACFKGELEIAVFRSSWTDPDATYTGLRAGKNYLSHAHLDIGSFILDALGQRWILDIGKENYNLPNYWNIEGGRWQYYRLRAEGHNTLVINPDGTPDQKIETHAPITKFKSGENSPFVVADISDVYHQKPATIQRGLKLLNRKNVLLQDEIYLDTDSDLYWFAHTPAQITLNENNTIATLTQNNKTLRATILSPKNATFTIMPAKPLPTSPKPEGQEQNEGIQKLTIHLPDAKQLTLAVLFEPVDNEHQPSNTIEIIPLEKW